MTLIKIIAHSSSKSSSIKIGEVLDVYVKEPADKDKAKIQADIYAWIGAFQEAKIIVKNLIIRITT